MHAQSMAARKASMRGNCLSSIVRMTTQKTIGLTQKFRRDYMGAHTKAARNPSTPVRNSSSIVHIRIKCRNEHSYAAYIENPSSHPRRTLDQYHYYNMDTSKGDADQMIQRHQSAQANRGRRRYGGQFCVRFSWLLSKILRTADETTIKVD
jgi:hypothetical protein